MSVDIVVKIIHNHINGRIHPNQVVMPPDVYDKAIEEQSDNCREHHGVGRLVKDGLNLEHFLCCGIPVVRGSEGLEGAIIIFYNGVVSKFEKIYASR